MFRFFLLRVCQILVLFMIVSGLHAQSEMRADSLIQTLRFIHDDRTKAIVLLQISNEEQLRDPRTALKYAQQALDIAKKSDYDSAEIKAMINIGINYSRINLLKEAIDMGSQIVEKATKNNMQNEIADGRTIMAVAYAQVGDYDNSSRLYFENLKLYEKINNKRLQGRTLGNIGADFIDQQSWSKALEYTNKALKIGIETGHLTLVTDQYNNLAAIHQVGLRDFDKAMQYYYLALEVAKQIEDYQQQGGIMLNIGRIYEKKNNPDSAYYYFTQAFLIFQRLDNPILLADSYIALGNFSFKEKSYSEGRKFAIASLNIGKEHGKLQTIYDASHLLYEISLATKDSLGAFRYHLLLTNAKDSLYVLQNKNELFRLEFQYNQDKIIKEQKIKQLKYYFILGFIILGLVSILIITMLFISRQKIKIKNTLLERDKAETTLKFKSKELSINLLALLNKNELIAEISQKLSQLGNVPLKTDLREEIIKLNRDIKQNTDSRLWQEFSLRFKETNSDFYDKILKLYPDLTQSELKLCAYLRLNMSTKEISDLTGQRTESIDTARYRLRKKFGLNNSESNLITFLSQI